MKNEPRVFDLMRNLSEKDLIQVSEMLESSYFSKNPKSKELFSFLKGYCPTLKSEDLEKKVLIEKLNLNVKNPEKKYRVLCSEISQVIEKYLLLEVIEKNPFSKNMILLEHFQKIGAKKSMDIYENRIQKLQDKSSFRDSDFYRDSYQFTELKLEKITTGQLEKRADLVFRSLSELENYYQITKSNLELELVFFKQIGDFENPYKDKSKDNLLLQLNRMIRVLNESDDIRILKKANDLFFSRLEEVRPFLRRELLLGLINYPLKNAAKNPKLYSKMAFEMYNEGLDKEILIVHNQITSITFMNVVVLGLKAGLFDKVQKFIIKNENHLPVSEAKDTILICEAMVHFYKKEFSEALELLNKNKFSNPRQEPHAKLMIVQCSYESFKNNINEDYYSFLSLVQNFERWIIRNRSYGKDLKNQGKNFTLLMKKVISYKKTGKPSKTEIQNLLLKRQPAWGIDWLKEMIENIE